MKPQLRVAYLEETQDWDTEIARAAGRIAGLYVYDTRLRVHCCEMTASYELSLAGYLTEHHVDDAVQMLMLQATDAGSISYVHCWQVDGFTAVRRRPGFRDIDPFVPGGLPCTLALPGPWPASRDDAIAEALTYLTQCGFTTT
jgi:hypothetical protein